MLVIRKISFPCLWDKYFHFKCPGCGLTRAFRSIVALDFISALKYNILSPFLFIIFIIGMCHLIYDVIKNKNSVEKLFDYLSKFYLPILFLAIIATILNNVFL